MNKKTDKNPRGAGRNATGVKRVTISISGQPEQIQKLKKLAKEHSMTISKFVLHKTGAE